MTDSLLKNPHDEARARIIWGESAAEVQDWLVREGLTEEQAEVIINNIRKERAYEIRRSGLRSIWIGVIMLLGSAALWTLIRFLYRIPYAVLIAAVGLTLIGLYKIVTGTLRLLSGSAAGSLTELD